MTHSPDDAAELVDGPCRAAMDAITRSHHTAGSMESRADLLREVAAEIRAAEKRGRESGILIGRIQVYEEGIAEIATAKAEAREAGAAEMRERAALTVEPTNDSLAAFIRALPLAPEKHDTNEESRLRLDMGPRWMRRDQEETD